MVGLTYYQLLRNCVIFGHDLKNICLLVLYCIVGVRDGYFLFNSFFIILMFRFFSFFCFKLIRYNWGEFLYVDCDPIMRSYVSYLSHMVGVSCLIDRRLFGFLTNFRSYVVRFFGRGGCYSNLFSLMRLPSCVFIFSVLWSPSIVLECRWLHIPVGGIVDSNFSGLFFSFPVPGNDDSVSSVVFMCKVVSYIILICRFRVIR
jgi:ribosomal protein S2